MGDRPASIGAVARRFRWRISLTMVLVVLEAGIALLFPLFIGFAVNDLIDDSLNGVVALAGVGLAALIVGSGRRYYDTRAYASIYRTVASEMVERERRSGASTSRITARSNLLTELVEFLENSMPELIGAVIGVVGTLAILAGINVGVLLGCLALLVLVVAIYWITARRNLRFNAGYNDELEMQVDAIASGAPAGIADHYARLMRWNVRLSDLETTNYAVFFLGVIALLFYAPIALVTDGVEAGFVVAALMYVFQYVEGLMMMPLHVQQAIRLREISNRLAATPEQA